MAADERNTTITGTSTANEQCCSSRFLLFVALALTFTNIKLLLFPFDSIGIEKENWPYPNDALISFDFGAAISTILSPPNNGATDDDINTTDWNFYSNGDGVGCRADNGNNSSKAKVCDVANGTIVTAYFQLRSEHSSEEYNDEWVRNTLSLQDAMVIYVSPSLVSTVMDLRAHAIQRTLVVPVELNDTRFAGSYSNGFWCNQWIMDPERGIHLDYQLYWVWNAKTEFLERTVDQNPFRSSFFAWVDMGYFRNKTYNGKTMLQRVLPPSDRITLLEIPRGNCGAGFIGGYSEGIKRWHQKYFQRLNDHKHQFIGKEQINMWETCATNPGLCDFVVPDKDHGDPWFYMTPYMMNLADDNGCRNASCTPPPPSRAIKKRTLARKQARKQAALEQGEPNFQNRFGDLCPKNWNEDE